MKRNLGLCLVVITSLALGACEKRPVVDSAVSADGAAIRYEAAGNGDVALVFVHCWTCNRGFWDAQVVHFAPRYQVVRLDLGGHGESGKGRKDYTVAAFGADVAAVADKLGLKKIVLVGHSMGGPVSVQAEQTLGARVIGVVGVDTFYTGFEIPKGEKGKQMAASFIKPFEQNFVGHAGNFMRSIFAPGADRELVERIAKNTELADKNMALSAMRNLFSWYQTDAEAGFQRVGARLRNINGDPKGENKPGHASVVLIAGSAHFPAQEKPAEFNRALEDVVKQLVSASAK